MSLSRVEKAIRRSRLRTVERALYRAASDLRLARDDAQYIRLGLLAESCEAVALQADDLRRWVVEHRDEELAG